MDLHDLNLAFYERLIALSVTDIVTVSPDAVFDVDTITSRQGYRRGHVMLAASETIGFGHGVYTRVEGFYQIDICVPRKSDYAYRTLNHVTDQHINHFFPANGRGLTLVKNQTEAHIVSRPDLPRTLDRKGAFLQHTIDIDFYVDVNPSA